MNTQTKVPSTPKMLVIGAGGCGINIARMVDSVPGIAVEYFDTSDANVREGDTSFTIVGSGRGSGGNRAENAAKIEADVSKLDLSGRLEFDIVVVAYSASGGSGSVIGPVLSRVLASRKPDLRLVNLMVADSGSGVWATNTSGTLETLEAICEDLNLRLPCMIFENRPGMARSRVDECIFVQLASLIEAMVAPTIEMDTQDRLNFLDPSSVIDTTVGLKILVTGREGDTSDGDLMVGFGRDGIADSLMASLVDDGGDLGSLILKKDSNFKKIGYRIPDHKGSSVWCATYSDISAIESVMSNIDTMVGKIDSQVQSSYSFRNRRGNTGGRGVIGAGRTR
jgi:hypothetical protein